tara:strand:+ start:55 stop:645 length:591 start_codon:yes stop_codon:yes gene_type:complete
MSNRFIPFFLFFCSFLFSISSYQTDVDILGFLKQIQNTPRIIPQTKIEGAVITISDQNQITMIIECDTLLIVDSKQNVSTPTILQGNVNASFYDDNQEKVSVLKSDMAEYIENYSLVAENNITVYNEVSKDSLFFVSPSAKIEWNDISKKIESNDQFILKHKDGDNIICTTGSSFHSNVDLTDMTISKPRTSNGCQ